MRGDSVKVGGDRESGRGKGKIKVGGNSELMVEGDGRQRTMGGT